MKNLTLKGFLIVVAVIFSFSSCKKEEGPQGPPGKDGNANVKTQIITVTPGEWNTNNSTLYVIKDVSIITSDIANSGAVMVYLKATNSSSYQALPYTWPGNNERIMRFWYSKGSLEIDIYEENGPASTPTSTYTFKVVAIEGNLAEKNTNVNYNNYNEVKEYYNLKD